MSLRNMFENRSGRVVALFRVVLAFVFFAAVLLEPDTKGAAMLRGQMLVGGYLLLSIAVIPALWCNWWRDHVLALPLLVLDVVVFLCAVFVTEGTDADFTSPFLAIFALTVLSATLRWDWRASAQTGVIVTLLFIAAGLTVIAMGLPLDSYRFVRRALYMAALLLVLVWFGMQRTEPRVPRLVLTGAGQDDDAMLWQALDYARSLTRASTGLIGWSAADEPWTQLRAFDVDGRRTGRTGPEHSGAMDELRDVILFDRRQRRCLQLDVANRPFAAKLHAALPLADWGGVEEGLALPISGVSGSGVIVLGGITGPGADFLALGKAVAREVRGAFDRVAMARLEREAVVSRTRSAVARDLHDSAAQSLAGACFRLEALRRKMRAEQPGAAPVDPGAAETEIVSVRDALRREQSHIRSLIDALRSPAHADRRDLRADIDATLGDSGAHWGMAVALDSTGQIDVPGWLSHEVQQLVREAVANAARHGKANRIAVRLEQGDGRIALHITDNGTGFDPAMQGGQPWSISERVTSLGGILSVDNAGSGAHLAIVLPHVPTNGTMT